MSCFSAVTNVTAKSDLDLTKHVNYTAGMILGVDDFTQEFGYLANRTRWLARDALGYGTLAGLAVRIETDGEKGRRVMVEPGVALSPRGQLICVPAAQCAYLNQWLAAADRKQLDERIARGAIGSPPAGARLKLYVVLCYRECLTDEAPIPGEPCRHESELQAASRVKDDFALELRFAPPAQTEEDAVRRYVERLKGIEVVAAGASTPLAEFLEAIRARWKKKNETGPPASPPAPVSPPPLAPRIHADDFCEYMRAAFRLWTTELRYQASGRETGCAVEMTGGGKLEDCVLLAALDVPLAEVSPGWQASDTEEPTVADDTRPFLLHLRMLQEWMLCGCQCRPETPAPVTSPPILSPPLTSPPVVSPPVSSPPVSSPPVTSPPLPHEHSLDSLSDVAVPSPADGQALVFRGAQWVAENLPETAAFALDELTDVAASSPSDGQTLVFRGAGWVAETPAALDHGALGGLGDDDHPQYLLANGSRALGGNLDAGGNRLTNLAAASAGGEAVIFQQAVKNGDAAGGDLAGNYPNPSIGRLQNNPLNAAAPAAGDALVWNGAAWAPQRIAGQPVEPRPFLILPLATVTRREANVYEVWFNIDAPGNLAEIRELTRENLRISDETETAPTFLESVRFRTPARQTRNVFEVVLAPADQTEPDYLRFAFDVNRTRVVAEGGEQTLLEYMERNDIRFAGFLRGNLATVFVRGAGARRG